MGPIIEVDNLSKLYRLGRRHSAPYGTLREAVVGLFRKPPSSLMDASSETTLWALKDISFDVTAGEVLGVIGRNGAGKSTLLRVLSRVTEPTTGCVRLYGRVGSLLEIGTGFHPELTGRENVFLNGAVLGMRRAEIVRKFDEILGFAEVERFIDTPVKHYSSGMYLRLAFAVAAHLDPEILLVDEVLAVGDASFQRKCLGKMGDVARAGRTVLFISHNLGAVRSLCNRALLLDGGRIVFRGSVGETIDRYMTLVLRHERAEVDLTTRQRGAVADTILRINCVRVLSPDGRPLVRAGEPIDLELIFEVNEPLEEVVLGVSVDSLENLTIAECRSSHDYGVIPHLSPGHYRIQCRITQNPLRPGRYGLSVGARTSRRYLDYVPQAMAFQVGSDLSPDSPWLAEGAGVIRLVSRWTNPTVVERRQA
jgi:lipopolysaccharide transport system ATP-binding protein